MRSWKTRLLALFAVAALLTSIAGPAMAQDFERCRDFGDDVVRCDGDFFVEADNDFFVEDDNDFFVEDDEFFFDPFFFSPFFFVDDFGFVSDCPFAGDFEGSINQFDCFD